MYAALIIQTVLDTYIMATYTQIDYTVGAPKKN